MEASSCKSSRATEMGDPIDFVACSNTPDRVARSLKSATTREARKMLTLEELERNRGKFFYFSDN